MVVKMATPGRVEEGLNKWCLTRHILHMRRVRCPNSRTCPARCLDLVCVNGDLQQGRGVALAIGVNSEQRCRGAKRSEEALVSRYGKEGEQVIFSSLTIADATTIVLAGAAARSVAPTYLYRKCASDYYPASDNNSWGTCTLILSISSE